MVIICTGVEKVYSQLTYDKYEAITNYKPEKDSFNTVIARLKNPLTPIESKNKKVLNKYKEINISREKYLSSLYSAGMIMGNDSISFFVQELLDFIVQQNTDELNQYDYKIFVLRNTNVNAFNLGEGIIVITLGMLQSVNNVQELAYTICHELGHDYLLHVTKRVESRSFEVLDDKLLKELAKASKNEYGSTSAQLEILIKRYADRTLHSRQNEFSADSSGLYFFEKAGFEKKYALSLLTILDNADRFWFEDSLDIATLLSTNRFTVQDQYLENKNIYPKWMTQDGLYDIPDSLKTHPDCKLRIQNIEHLNYRVTNNRQKQLYNFDAKFSNLRRSIRHEFLHTYIEEGAYCHALYFALCIKKGQYNQFDQGFVDGVIVLATINLALSIKSGTFTYHAPFPSEFHPRHFNKFLEFVHNLSSKKYIQLSDSYLNEKFTYANEREIIKVSRLILKLLKNSETSKSTLKERMTLLKTTLEKEGISNYYYIWTINNN